MIGAGVPVLFCSTVDLDRFAIPAPDRVKQGSVANRFSRFYELFNAKFFTPSSSATLALMFRAAKEFSAVGVVSAQKVCYTTAIFACTRA